MARTRRIVEASRVAALGLLVTSAFLVPAGLGRSAAFASLSKTCGASCPCDDAGHDGREGGHEDHAEEPTEQDPGVDGHADSEHGPDECPDDCPSCGCCFAGVAMAVLPLPLTSSATSRACPGMLAPLDARATGMRTGVFRPPRGRT